jgi:hypothetical protein
MRGQAEKQEHEPCDAQRVERFVGRLHHHVVFGGYLHLNRAR